MRSNDRRRRPSARDVLESDWVTGNEEETPSDVERLRQAPESWSDLVDMLDN